MSKETDLVGRAQELSQSVTTGADLSNALFDPFDGLLALAFPTPEERHLFIRTKEFEKIHDILDEAVERFGLVEGANPTMLTGFMRRSSPKAAEQLLPHVDSGIETLGPSICEGIGHNVHSQSFIFSSITACVRLKCNGVTVM